MHVKLFRVLQHAGFVLDRIEGSHHIFWRARDGHIVSVPVHGGKTFGKGLLHGILKDADITPEDVKSFLSS